ncbi:MAG: DeoR/GlpR transcriptional regulator [Planctomycetota bacterium]|nr:DeoR/GlpR transcriptional regulator [Planctomycetota bacterium]
MLAETRRRQLLDLITRQGFATLDELVRASGVSESTVRRDLETLDLSGQVRRTHGGAVLVGDSKPLPAFEDRTATAAAEKRAIGRAAAALLEDGDSVLLDGGTTTLEIARALVGRPMQVVTNSLPIAQLLAMGPRTDLILIGGYVYPRTGVALGPLAIASMTSIRVRHAILGAGGIVEDGIYNHNLLLVETELRMIECAQDVMIVADHTKFGRQALTRLCGLDAVRVLVSDDKLPASWQSTFRRAGAAVHLAAAGEETLNVPSIPPNGLLNANSTASDTANVEARFSR